MADGLENLLARLIQCGDKQAGRQRGILGRVDRGRPIEQGVKFITTEEFLKDLRTSAQTSDTQAVMDGALDQFVNAWFRAGCPLKRMPGVKDGLE
jgi:protein subunit release factor B